VSDEGRHRRFREEERSFFLFGNYDDALGPCQIFFQAISETAQCPPTVQEERTFW
jgi:hypothetical protein